MAKAHMTDARPIWERVRDFFAEDDPAASSIPHHRVGPPRSANAGLTDEQQFEETLRNLISKNSALAAGRIQFLNLAKLRKKLGNRWDKVSERIHAITQRVLDANLSEKDCYTVVGDSAYLIVFDDLSEEEAKVKSIFLARTILTRLLGESADFEALELRTAVKQLDGSIRFEKVSLVDALESALNQAHSSAVSKASLGRDPATELPDEAIAHGLSQLLQMAEVKFDRRHDRQAEKQADSEDTPTIEDLLDILRQAEAGLESLPAYDDNEIGWDDNYDDTASKSGTEGPDAFANDRRRGQTDAVLEPGLSVIYGSGNATNGAPSPELVFSYLPMWHVPRTVVSGYLGQLGLRLQGQVVRTSKLVPEGTRPEIVAALDIFVLRQVLSDLCRMLENEAINALIVPVHYATLTSGPTRDRYFRLCNAVPTKLRRFIVYEIVGSSEGSWHSQLFEAVSTIKRFCRAVLFRCDVDYEHFEGLAGMGIFAVGTELAQNDGLTDTAIIRKVEEFATRANRFKLRTYIHGLGRKTEVTAAVCAGYHHIGGEAIAPAVENPQGIIPFSVLNVYGGGLAAPST